MFIITGTKGYSVQTSVGVGAGQVETSAVIQIPATASGGEWSIHILSFSTGTEFLPLASKDAVFKVIPNENLIFPSSAEVYVNPNQQQLLRTAALEIRSRIQTLKNDLAEHQAGPARSEYKVVRSNVEEAMKALDATQAEYRKLAEEKRNDNAEVVFFEDLRTNYDHLLRLLEHGNVRSSHAQSNGWVLVDQQTEASTRQGANESIIALAALRPFEQNELAYNVAATTGSLTFNLTVKSNPEGANICYYRRGDPCHQDPQKTNTTIMSLPLAIWTVQFQKDGFKTETREHDPFRESDHVVEVTLRQ